MNSCNAIIQEKGVLAKIGSFFARLFDWKRTPQIADAEDVLAAETSDLKRMLQNTEGGEGTNMEEGCRKIISESFRKLVNTYPAQELDALYIWPKYVKIAIHLEGAPIDDLLEHVTENNYLALTKSITVLIVSLEKNGNKEHARRAERYAEAVYRRIVETIDPKDMPANLYLGRAAQKRGEYSEAQKWFLRVSDAENGATALLACYAEEVKVLLTESKRHSNPSPHIYKRINDLNQRQYDIYNARCKALEEKILNGGATKETKRSYVVFATGYARFERLRDNYDLALDCLMRIPDAYPEVYRVYQEEAMIYQYRSPKNTVFSLEKAVEAFKKAEAALLADNNGKIKNQTAMKCILVPLANTYYSLGMYAEAKDVCERVLQYDKSEQRVINLKRQIKQKEAF